MDFELSCQEDDQSETGIILNVPTTTTPLCVPETVGFGARDDSSCTQMALSCSSIESVGSFCNSVLSTSPKPLTVTFQKYGRHTIYPISMVVERYNREVWVCYAPEFKDHLVFAANYLSDSCWGSEISGRLKAIRNIKGRGIPECFGIATSGRDDGLPCVGFASKERSGSFSSRNNLDGRASLFRLPKGCSTFPRADGSHKVVNTAYLEFFPGVALADVVERSSFHLPFILAKRWSLCGRRPLSDRVIAHLLRGVLDGLLALHECGMAHGNLRPDVVIVSPDLRVSLYGAAFLSASVDADRLRWRAPDLSLNTRNDYTSSQRQAGDVWAFGCLAFYLVTYKVPFQGKDDVTSVMSHLNLLRFGASKETNVFQAPGAMPSDDKWTDIFGDFREVKNKDLRDLITQCIELSWTERPTVAAIRNHRLFKERCYVIRHFRQKEVRCFMERTGLDTCLDVDNIDGVVNLESLVTLNPVKYQYPPDAIPCAYPSNEINELLLSFIIKDLFMWVFILGIRRRRKIAEARLRARGCSGRSPMPLLRQQLLNLDISSDIYFPTVKLTHRLAKLIAFVITEAALVGVDCKKFLPECVTSADADEDLHRISVHLSRLFSVEDTVPEYCMDRSIHSCGTNAESDAKAPANLHVPVGEQLAQGCEKKLSVPTLQLLAEIYDVEDKIVTPWERHNADNVEVNCFGAISDDDDPTTDDTVISLSLSDIGNENVIERELLQGEANAFSTAHTTPLFSGLARGIAPVSVPRFLNDGNGRLIIIFSLLVFLVVVVVSVSLTTVFGSS